MAQIVYILCAATSLLCALLLGRAYRTSRVPLLLWSTVCFAFLTLSNVILFVDLALLPVTIDLRPWRTGASLAGAIALLYGLIIRNR